MQRRQFLRLLGSGVFASWNCLVFPSSLWAENSFGYALQGQELIQKKRYREAIEVLKKAIEADPKNDWAVGLLARALLGQGDKADALDAFREAVRLNPDDSFSRMMLEKITQKPMPWLKKKQKPLTPLERDARREEELTSKRIRSEKGLGYQVERVVIDAGHGGFDNGAVGASGLKEKDVTLDLALRLNEKLKAKGRIKSFLTRTGDYYVPLSARTVTANQFHADLFISLHINANKKRSANGSETYFCSEKASSTEAKKVAALENAVIRFDEPYKQKPGYIDIEEILFKFEQKLYWKESGRFAKGFQQKFKTHLPFRSRGVHSANFYVLRRAKMPSILLETGFISNFKEEEVLKKPGVRDKIADSIVRGLV